MAKCIEGCCEVLLLMGIRGKKDGTSHVDNRVIKARMGYSAGNRLPLGGIFIPGTIFLGNWPKISWPEKVQLRCRAPSPAVPSAPPAGALGSREHDTKPGRVVGRGRKEKGRCADCNRQ
jgi:hypothetical protein